MNLAMSPEDEDVAGDVDIILKEGSSSQQRREAAGKVGHAVNESMAPSQTASPICIISGPSCLQTIHRPPAHITTTINNHLHFFTHLPSLHHTASSPLAHFHFYSSFTQ